MRTRQVLRTGGDPAIYGNGGWAGRVRAGGAILGQMEFAVAGCTPEMPRDILP